MIDCDTAWRMWCNNDAITPDIDASTKLKTTIPEPTELYISTTTIIGNVGQQLDIDKLFWLIPIIDYDDHNEGIIKKEMKFVFKTSKDNDKVDDILKLEKHYTSHIISYVNNPYGTVKYRVIKKISVGLSKKDITNYRCKKKGAFYNCFVIIMRIKLENGFNEVHIKLFNTGKFEIPGIKSKRVQHLVLYRLYNTIKECIQLPKPIYSSKINTVLINSNFNCNFNINREKLFEILKNKYNFNTQYDPCSYPGIMSKHEKADRTVSFMIFRTGSVLIVGKCEMEDINEIYIELKDLLMREYDNIYQACLNRTLHKKTKKPITLTKLISC